MSPIFEFFDVGLLGTLIGVIVGGLITRHYAVKGFEHLRDLTSRTDRLLETILESQEIETAPSARNRHADETDSRAGHRPAGQDHRPE